MPTRYITLSEGTSNVMTMFFTTIQIFIEINFEGNKITIFIGHMINISYFKSLLNSPKAYLINFIIYSITVNTQLEVFE